MDATEHDALRRAAVDMGPASLAAAALQAADRLEVEALAYRLAAVFMDVVNSKATDPDLHKLLDDLTDVRIAGVENFSDRLRRGVERIKLSRRTAATARQIGSGYKRSGG